MCEICSKLARKTAEWRQWRRSGFFSGNCEHISPIVLVFPLLTLNKDSPVQKTCHGYLTTNMRRLFSRVFVIDFEQVYMLILSKQSSSGFIFDLEYVLGSIMKNFDLGDSEDSYIEDEADDAVLQTYSIKHAGCVNRIRVFWIFVSVIFLDNENN